MNDNNKEKNMTDDATTLEILTRQRVEIVAQLDNLTESLKQIDAQLLALAPPRTELLMGGRPVFRINVSNNWNDAKAREVLPPELLAAITVTETVTRIDKATAKNVLPPALYQACTKPSKPSVAKVTGR